MIVKSLLDIQHRYGYLPQEELEFLALRAGVPLYRVEELTTFFPHFRRKKSPDEHLPEVTIHLCQSMTCHLRGAPGLIEEARKFAATHPGRVEVCAVSCLGRCDRAPVAFVSRHAEDGPSFHDQLHTELVQTSKLPQLLENTLAGKPMAADHDDQNNGAHPAWRIDLYDARHGTSPEPYAAVKRFLRGELTSESVIKQIEDADLVGMGGAAARTGKKWKDVRDARGDKRYLICNADESEPGTFKDRELLLHTPHLIVEGMLLAGLTLGAQKRETRGYIYIRHEYPEQIAACNKEIERAAKIVPEAMSLCPLEVFVSPGLYICGEESALIEVIEGKRAQPRNQPPDIRNNGLFDQPTLVNNVETYAWVPSILLREPKNWYEKEPLRFFSLSGDVRKPGVYEVSFRCTLGQLIELAGGMRDGLEFHAVAPSGPSGGFLPATLDGNEIRATLSEDAIKSLEKRSPPQGARVRSYRQAFTQERISVRDLPLDVPLFRTLGLSLGAGVVVYGAKKGEKLDMLGYTLNLLQFFEKESCGKCVPCRLGCQQLVHFAGQLHDKRSLPMAPPESARIGEIVRQLTGVMEITSICGLGRAASTPFRNWLEYFQNPEVRDQRSEVRKP